MAQKKKKTSTSRRKLVRKKIRKKTLAQFRREGDIWTCPGCGRDNVHSYSYALKVLNRNALQMLAGGRGKSLDNIPVTSGSSFETACGACGRYFAPIHLEGGSRNPILHEAYTHEDYYDD